jgi:hypothetical protein
MTWVFGLCTIRSLIICAHHQILFVYEGKKNQKGGVSGKLGERVGNARFGREN